MESDFNVNFFFTDHFSWHRIFYCVNTIKKKEKKETKGHFSPVSKFIFKHGDASKLSENSDKQIYKIKGNT